MEGLALKVLQSVVESEEEAQDFGAAYQPVPVPEPPDVTCVCGDAEQPQSDPSNIFCFLN